MYFVTYADTGHTRRMWGASPLSDSRKGVSARQCVPAGAEGCQATVTGGTGRSACCTMFGGKTTAQTAPGTRLHTNTPQFCEGGAFYTEAQRASDTGLGCTTSSLGVCRYGTVVTAASLADTWHPAVTTVFFLVLGTVPLATDARPMPRCAGQHWQLQPPRCAHLRNSLLSQLGLCTF